MEAPQAEGEDHSHIFRFKTRMEMVQISAVVMGIEFCYAAEMSFVSPILLKLGVQYTMMTLYWCLSPIIGFFLTPILGSLSDNCKLSMGRRRPFILVLSIGIIIGLLLIPNGEVLGCYLGDDCNGTETSWDVDMNDTSSTVSTESNEADPPTHHSLGIFFTIVGIVLMDFSADACQSPARAYLLDVTLPDNHGVGLTTFTIMAGLGGFIGFIMGAVDWDSTVIGWLFGGHVRAVFTMVLFIYIACVVCTITSFREIPLDKQLSAAHMHARKNDSHTSSSHRTLEDVSTEIQVAFPNNQYTEGSESVGLLRDSAVPAATLKQYLSSIVNMPRSLRLLCVTNFFCWMSNVCYSLYFTDFVGEAVFGGDPSAPEGSAGRLTYDEGVRFGCWGMAVYSLSCSCYSFVIEKLVKKIGARPVYICSQLLYSCGMLLMTIFPNKVSVILLSCTAGVMYSTLFTMPYLLVAHYHATQTTGFERPDSEDSPGSSGLHIRGLGTDVAILSSMMFLAQFLQAVAMGHLVILVGSTAVVVAAAAFLAMCGAVSATQLEYLDL